MDHFYNKTIPEELTPVILLCFRDYDNRNL